MSVILQRIKEYYEQKGMSSREFSLSIGRSGAYFSNSIKKGSEPTADLLSTIFDTYPDLNIVWVFTGVGNRTKIKNAEGVQEEGLVYNRSIDDLIDDKIDKKIDSRIKTLTETIRELIVNEMEDELEAAREELRRERKKGGIK